MTYEETRQILSVLKTAYPQSFLHWTKEQGEAFLSLWSKGLQDDDLLDVMVAVLHFIQDSDREFAPTIGMIRKYIRSMPHYMLIDQAIKYFPENPKVQQMLRARGHAPQIGNAPDPTGASDR